MTDLDRSKNNLLRLFGDLQTDYEIHNNEEDFFKQDEDFEIKEDFEFETNDKNGEGEYKFIVKFKEPVFVRAFGFVSSNQCELNPTLVHVSLCTNDCDVQK